MSAIQQLLLSGATGGGGGLPTARRYWRMRITKVALADDTGAPPGWGYGCVQQFQLLNATVSQFTGGSGSTNGGVAQAVSNAFDGSPTAGDCFAASPVSDVLTLVYDMGVGNTATGDSVKIYNEIAANPFYGSPQGSPRDFTIDSSPDAAAWTTIATVVDQTWSNSTDQNRTITF